MLEHVRKSGFDGVLAELIEKGVVYIGTSAGSVLVGHDINTSRRFDDPAKGNISDYRGLQFVDFAVIPHVDEKKYGDKLKATLEEWKDRPVKIVGLTNAQALLVTDNFIELVDVAMKVNE
jgi:dipeptidase E